MAIFTVETRGIGKPDYSREISMGQVRPGLTLRYRQNLKRFGVSFSPIASIYPWIKAPLAAGATSHFVDWETGLDMPYTCLQGYITEVVWLTRSTSQDSVIRAYFSTPALGIPLQYAGNLGIVVSGFPHGISDVVPVSTAAFDPTAQYVHETDMVIENLGGANMEGSFSMVALLEAVGTSPLPPDKTVKCKWCGHEWVVPKETTYIKCPECGEMNIYCDFSKYRGVR